MPLVSELAAVIAEVAKVVKDTRAIVEAVHDGAKFLAAKYPEINKDFGDLLDQMQLTIVGLAKITGVLGGFRFVVREEVDPTLAAAELVRFNKYVIKQGEKVDALKGDLRKLKADCEEVLAMADKLDADAGRRGLDNLFGLLGDEARKRSDEMSRFLRDFYGFGLGR